MKFMAWRLSLLQRPQEILKWYLRELFSKLKVLIRSLRVLSLKSQQKLKIDKGLSFYLFILLEYSCFTMLC